MYTHDLDRNDTTAENFIQTCLTLLILRNLGGALVQCEDPLGITVQIETISGRSARTCEKSEGLNFLALLAYQKITLLDECF